MQKKTLIFIQLHLLLSFTTLSYSLPLSTSSRWIIDEPTGARVKLTCANWAAHLEPMLPEGLNKRPVADIAKHVAQMGFNCVRLTWATYMFTRYDNQTVAQSFRGLGLEDELEAGIAKNNPEFVNMNIVDAQRAVIDELGKEGVMVVLDNQVSQPMWCCSDNDGNGFFGDKYFDVDEWLRGLDIVAKRYKDTPTVVAMSIRNELRGPQENTTLWYQYVHQGARTIHRANPDLLVIVSGLHYDLDFTFLKEKPLKIDFQGKLVYETHRYSFTAGEKKLWQDQPFTKACQSITQEINDQVGFLTEGEHIAPLFVSEFGVNQMGVDRADNMFLGCFLGYLADMDLDWSVWALQGSYYLRDGQHGPDETYGMLDKNWRSLRNPEFHKKLQLIQQRIQDPSSTGSAYYIMYHSLSGRCVHANDSQPLTGDCLSFSKWDFTGDGSPIQLLGTDSCLSAAGDGIPVSLSLDCSGSRSKWELAHNSTFQLANKADDGTYLCLDWDPNYSSTVLLTKKCMCLEDDDHNSCQENPQSQWFKLVSANVQ